MSRPLTRFSTHPTQQWFAVVIMVGIVMVVSAQGIDLLSLIVSGAFAYAVGTLPMGATLIRAVSGFDPRRVHAYTLGIENLYHFVGAPLAVASFGLDVAKGALTLIFIGFMRPAATALAMVAVFVGHLYPLPKLATALPRGRGWWRVCRGGGGITDDGAARALTRLINRCSVPCGLNKPLPDGCYVECVH